MEHAIEHARNRGASFAGRARQERETADPFTGESPAIRRLAEQAQRVVATTSPILICGESGTGKGLLAGWLHRHGTRSGRAFVDLNCAGLTKDLLESELFGHEREAFTGAVSAEPGLLEIADRGTLFLDELGDMDAQIQPKLLKVLEEQALPARRRREGPAGRCPPHRRDPPRPCRAGRGGTLPGGPLLPPERDPPRGAAPAGPGRRRDPHRTRSAPPPPSGLLRPRGFPFSRGAESRIR